MNLLSQDNMNLLSQDNIDSVRITSRDSVRPAAVALHRIALACGMRAAPAHNIAGKETPVDAEGRILAAEVFEWGADERAWWRNKRLALASPLTAACRFGSEPFWVNAQGFHTFAPNPYLDGISLENFEKLALTSAAIVVPVHLPFGQIGAVSFNLLDQERTDLAEEFFLYRDGLGFLSRLFISTYVQIMGSDFGPLPPSRLSKREVECLRWAAIGKTDFEISMIMGISHATVRFHLRNAAAKLNAVNRGQTLFKAAQLGFIAF